MASDSEDWMRRAMSASGGASDGYRSRASAHFDNEFLARNPGLLSSGGGGQPVDWAESAWTHLQAGNLELAEDCLLRAQQHVWNHPWVDARLVDVRVQLGRWSDAVAAGQEALQRQSPVGADFFCTFAVALAGGGLAPDEAEDALNKARQRVRAPYPGDLGPTLWLGRDADSAMQAFAEGMVRWHQQRYDLACEAFAAAKGVFESLGDPRAGVAAEGVQQCASRGFHPAKPKVRFGNLT